MEQRKLKLLSDLHPDWVPRVCNDGSVLFINANQHLTQFEHPEHGERLQTCADLPFGWERTVRQDGNVVFLNHLSQSASCEDPRLQGADVFTGPGKMEQKEQQLRQRFDANSTADQVLQGLDLKGKTFVITGGTSGVGAATVQALAKKGAHVVFTGRNAKAGSEIIRGLQLMDANLQVDFVPLDLNSLQSVRYFAEKLKAKQITINGLILNAGVFGTPYETTVDGFESMFQTNVLSQLYLTILLKELLDKSVPARVLFVSSESHRAANLSVLNLTTSILSPSHNTYSAWTQYNNTKFCQILLSSYLQQLWGQQGITFYALHPGNMILTGISRSWWFWKLAFGLAKPFTKTLEQGAATTAFCVARPELQSEGGKYWNNCWMCDPSTKANPELAKALFNMCQDMIASKISDFPRIT